MKAKVVIIIVFLTLFFVGCNNAPQGKTVDTNSSPSLSPSIPLIPTRTLTALPTRTYTSTSTFTPTPTPMLPSTKEPITANNLYSLRLLATWGKGTIIDAKWLFDDQSLVVHTKAGVYVFDPSDWSQKKEWFGGKALAISHNREVIAVGFGEGRVLIWNAKTNQNIEIDQIYKKSVESEIPDALALSSDGTILAIAGTDAHTGLWNTQSGEWLEDLPSSNSFYIVAFSPDEKRLIGTDTLRNTVIWDTERKKQLIVLTNAGYYSNFPFSPDASQLVTVQDYDITIWNTKTGAIISRRLIGKNPKFIAKFSEDGLYIVVNDYEQIIRVSDGMHMPLDTIAHPQIKPLPDFTPLETTDFFPGNITGTGIAGKDTLVAWGSKNIKDATSILWWDIKNHNILPPDWSHCVDVHSGFDFGILSISPDCSLEAVANGRLFYLYQTSDHTLLHNLFSHAQDISAVTFASNGKYFASGAGVQTGEVVLWRTNPTAGTLMAVGSSLNVYIYNILQQQLIKVIPGWAEAIAFSPDNKMLAVACNYHRKNFIEVISMENLTYKSLQGNMFLSPLGDFIPNPWTDIYQIVTTSLAFTPDSSGLLVGLSDGTVQFWGL
jgi:WD40 repeat protein